jgi:hypothetical protein
MFSKCNQLIILTATVLALAACGRQEQPAPPAAPASAPASAEAPMPTGPLMPPAPHPGTVLDSLELGAAVDAAGNLSGAPATTFTPKDTIHAVVKTTNNGVMPAVISAHWAYQGTTTVNDSSQTVSASGPSVTTFHIEKPSGFPAGAYSVAISIDGKEVGTKDFEVKEGGKM